MPRVGPDSGRKEVERLYRQFGRWWTIKGERRCVMTALTKREPTLERFGMFDWLFDDWMKVLPLHRPMFGRWLTEDMIHVDEFRENGTLVIRAELPGIDPNRTSS
jgi:hypothetical protein